MFVQNSLSGARVLVVEDDALLAITIASVLEHESALVVGPCASHHTAMNAVSVQLPHLALLDVNIVGGTSFVLAEWLASHQVPFAFIIGEPLEQIPKRLTAAGYLKKPAHASDLLTWLGVCGPRLIGRDVLLTDTFVIDASTSPMRSEGQGLCKLP